jgi:threonyl-tRNA synthetase
VATIQLDFNQPRNFNLTCINEKGEKEPILMIHCAIMGSIERFMSVLIEHYAGVFPLWLAPEQVRVCTVADAFIPAAEALVSAWRDAGVRVGTDFSSEKVGKKIREAAGAKTPWTVVIGGKEAEGGDIQVKVFGSEEALVIPQAEFLARISELTRV